MLRTYNRTIFSNTAKFKIALCKFEPNSQKSGMHVSGQQLINEKLVKENRLDFKNLWRRKIGEEVNIGLKVAQQKKYLFLSSLGARIRPLWPVDTFMEKNAETQWNERIEILMMAGYGDK